MVLLKNNSGFSVALPFPVGGVNSLNANQRVKATPGEYERLKKDHPLVLKKLMVFNMQGVASEKKVAAVVKKKITPKVEKIEKSPEEKKIIKEHITTEKKKTSID